ncbi:uncharacterized protein LOC131675436 [Phymastichus coffea]|uniref:uncharacterized protein LOC131675436 n=1 Tax=Phymastichus coffea TaxID=108790 RepID=UPI00273B67F0|nr:uncharacterized protein LOC131675436 [Phymastichus coffea]
MQKNKKPSQQSHVQSEKTSLLFWTTTQPNLNGVINLEEFSGKWCAFYLQHFVVYQIFEYHEEKLIAPPKFYIFIHEDSKITRSAEVQRLIEGVIYCQIVFPENSVSSKTIRLFRDGFEQKMYMTQNLSNSNFTDFDMDTVRLAWSMSSVKVIENNAQTIETFLKKYKLSYSSDHGSQMRD